MVFIYMVLKEKQLRSIIRNVIKEAIGFGFSFGRLKILNGFAAKVKYCKQCLGQPIGNGSSRICFQLNDNMILKLAKNAKGLAQNEQEGQEDYYRDSYGIFPKVYYQFSDNENYSFIVSEYVLPVKNSDFKHILGIDANTFYNFIETCASVYTRKARKILNDGVFENMLENEDLNNWYSFMCDYNFPPMDLRNANFGMALRDGEPKIVMLDSGLSEEIYNQYYKKH